MRFWWRVFPLLVGSLLTPTALAQSLDSATEARRTALFEEGRTLHLQGRHAEAVERLGEVVRLRRSPQALRALGLAEAAAGKLVAARGHLAQALQLANDGGPRSEVEPAKTALAEVTPRLPRLRLVLPADVPVGELSVLVDGARVELGGAGGAAAGAAGGAVAGRATVEVDAGAHTITARAADRADFTRMVQVSEGAVVEVRLELAARATTGAALRRPLGIGLAAVGGGGLVVGVVAGILAIGAHDELGKKCPAGACPDSARPSLDGYHALGMASTVAFVAGGVVAAAGAVVFFTAPHPAQSATVRVTPYLGFGEVGARVVF